MRLYEIYLVHEHVANDYFGKDEKLFQLFVEMKTTQDMDLKEIINKQIKYVTQTIPALTVFHCVERKARFTQNKYLHKAWQDLRISDGKGFVNLRCLSGHLIVEATGSLNQEAWVFEVLRTLDDYFLAVDCQNYNSGWLKPPKTVALIKTKSEV
ncbi:hypothetical protein GCM10011391_34250 [Pullulanibacillus camelliae]|uniref:Sporulation inhibitor of replication protein SirA n=1 Tax=Pullulanibacillus camelliae TaxID=1707096 RepID=A0A8J2YMF9_9BACL|nr:sporulation inhibitor of replication protein SirA [Pullulanibacillus camelliae]GGE52541.1 hypothetical protein GCM10011391_34250 [Pullulanibacillus camelliae]